MLALLALLLLPGLLVVRSPWWAVPFLSLTWLLYLRNSVYLCAI